MTSRSREYWTMEHPFSCFVIGSDSLLIECCELVLQRGADLRGVISDTPRIAEWARRKAVPVFATKGHAEVLRRQPFDYLLAITHLSMIPDDVLRLPGKAAINFHDGPLPRYAGLNAPAWALMNRESRYGITWHLVTAGADEGNILRQAEFDIAPDETSLTINTKCFEHAIATFGELVDDLAAGNIAGRAQDLTQRTYYAKHQRPADACTLDFRRSAAELDALVRALDFGQYPNPLGRVKLYGGRRVLSPKRSAARGQGRTAEPGTLLSIGEHEIEIATGDGVLALAEFATIEDLPLRPSEAAEALEASVGDRLPVLSPEQSAALTALSSDLAAHEAAWSRRLASLEPVEPPYAKRVMSVARSAEHESVPVTLPLEQLTALAPERRVAVVVAALFAYLSRVSGKRRFHLAFSDRALRERVRGFEGWFSSWVPLLGQVGEGITFEGLVAATAAELALLRGRGSWARDVVMRQGATFAGRSAGLSLGVVLDGDHAMGDAGALLTILLDDSGQTCRLGFDPAGIERRDVEAIAAQLATLLAHALSAPGCPVSELALLSPEQRQLILSDWNRTAVEFRKDALVHQLFEEQVGRTPNAVALAFEGQELTYRQLDERANRLAHHLRALGIGPGRLVGVCVERSLELVISVLGVLKAGGAYVPLDPDYPKDRIAFVLEDAGVQVLVTQGALVADLPSHGSRIVRIDDDWPQLERRPADSAASGANSSDLAYVIYTSGSTGKPKGVMVEHRNVVNFFTGMDAAIPHDPPGTWLAVTSLSFDISVLELLWTLARGFKVVVHRDRTRDTTAAEGPRHSARKLEFGIFLWGSDGGQSASKYELMLSAARFADAHGFCAMWTPERHFHAFGGPYPNPSVTGAAIAAVTERLQIRAGSCVLPLHHPVRVAEEWAVVDNISRGRTAVAFASGWQPDDFLLRPENYKNAKQVLASGIDTVRRLWRGEKVAFPGPLGKDVEIVTQPRPVQPELPYWVTTAGSPETYRLAGELGANVLTHLLGQTLEEVADKIRVYREARAAAGLDPDTGIVSLMLHTFVGDDDDEVRELVRAPMKEYLGSSVSLVKNYAWAFPAFKRPKGEQAKPQDIDLGSLTEAELDTVLDFAFERYFETSGLFGTPQRCVEMVERAKQAGVDEIACLIDFGVPTPTVLAGLVKLEEVRFRANAHASPGGVSAADYSIPALIERHRVTHMQCTPSMASMLTVDPAARASIGKLSYLMVGGEAFPPALAESLAGLVRERVTNMYGPTETTVWSATHRVERATGSVPIGRPIANTQLYVLDECHQPLPAGIPGELYIGGAGVVRGYHARPELTAERFVGNPFVDDPAARMYRTGDLASFRSDGVLEFLGRTDYQVKIRGHRIELGEIETLLGRHAAVREVVLVAREDTPGDQRLVAYIVADGAPPESDELRSYLLAKLPEFMVPAHIVVLERLPQTPNGKIDRKALPAPEAVQPRSEEDFVAPEGELEAAVAEKWKETLGLDRVGVNDNFFDLGGHSLLVVRLHRSLAAVVPNPISLTDLYRFPTIASLVAHLSDDDSGALAASAERGVQKRRDAMQRRRRRGRVAAVPE